MRVLSFIFIFLFSSFCCSVQAYAQPRSIDEKLASFNLDKKDIVIYIDKTAHTFTLMIGRLMLKQYKCVFGVNPVADKKCEGDRCTPEGEFHIIAKNPHKDWDKFMLIDYPTAQSWKKFNANKEHGIVAAKARIGGSVGIHGVPANKPYLIDKGINWTWGCISLSNADVDEVYKYVSVGTKVVITR